MKQNMLNQLEKYKRENARLKRKLAHIIILPKPRKMSDMKAERILRKFVAERENGAGSFDCMDILRQFYISAEQTDRIMTKLEKEGLVRGE